MKKIIIAVFLAIALMFPLSAFGAGSCERSAGITKTGFYVVKLACTGDASDGSIPRQLIATADEIGNAGARYLYQVKTYPTPGGTAPDAADVAVYMDNMDLLGGKGVNLIHATTPYDLIPYSAFMTAYRYPPITSNVSSTVTNQSTASATYTIELIFVK